MSERIESKPLISVQIVSLAAGLEAERNGSTAAIASVQQIEDAVSGKFERMTFQPVLI